MTAIETWCEKNSCDQTQLPHAVQKNVCFDGPCFHVVSCGNDVCRYVQLGTRLVTRVYVVHKHV